MRIDVDGWRIRDVLGGEMGMHELEIPTDGLIEDLSWSSISPSNFTVASRPFYTLAI